MVVVLRKLIVMPVQDASPTFEDLMMWVGSSLMLGVMFVLVRWGQKMTGPEPGTDRRRTDPD
jgi:hypothetical protein